jgi:hypothetical protein
MTWQLLALLLLLVAYTALLGRPAASCCGRDRCALVTRCCCTCNTLLGYLLLLLLLGLLLALLLLLLLLHQLCDREDAAHPQLIRLDRCLLHPAVPAASAAVPRALGAGAAADDAGDAQLLLSRQPQPQPRRKPRVLAGRVLVAGVRPTIAATADAALPAW